MCKDWKDLTPGEKVASYIGIIGLVITVVGIAVPVAIELKSNGRNDNIDAQGTSSSTTIMTVNEKGAAQSPGMPTATYATTTTTTKTTTTTTTTTSKSTNSPGHSGSNFCASTPCQHGGTCNNADQGYWCSCMGDYSGINCEHGPSNPPCELVAQCSVYYPPNVGVLEDVHDQPGGMVLVSGGYGAKTCSVSESEKGEPVPGESVPTPGTELFSTIVTHDGARWAAAYDNKAADKGHYLYRQDSAGLWQRQLSEQIKRPRGLDTDSNGLLLVLDTDGNKVHYVNPAVSPSIERTISVQESGMGAAQYIAALPGGRVAVGDLYKNCVRVWSQEGTMLHRAGNCHDTWRVTGILNGTVNLCADRQGRLMVADLRNSRIAVFDSSGNFLGSLCEGKVLYPRVVEVTAGGKLVVGDSHGIKVFNYDF